MNKGKKNGGEGIKLPPSGLAEDILGQFSVSGSPSDSPVRSAPAGPDRLYTFADTLHQHEEDHHAAMDILETWVVFELAGESFGLPVSHVQEILRVEGITRVPHAPHPVRGVTNMRGKVLPVVDLRVRLGLESAHIAVSSRILVVNARGRLMGLLVDAVQQVVRLSRKGIQPPPPDIMTERSDYILGVYQLEKELVILLDVERTLTVHDTSFHSERDLTEVEK